MSVGTFGKGLVGKLFDQPGQMYDKDLAKLGDYDVLGNEVRAGGLGSLRSALGSKYADHVDLRYVSGSGSFVLGKDAVPEGFDENELLGIFDTVTAHGSKSACAKLEESLYKADDAAKAKLPHVSETPPNANEMLRQKLRWSPKSADEYYAVLDILQGREPEAAEEGAAVSGGSVDLQEIMLKHGAHIGIVPMYVSFERNDGYGLVDERTGKAAMKAYRDGSIEIIDGQAAFETIGRLAADFRNVGRYLGSSSMEAMGDAWGLVQASIADAPVGVPYTIGAGIGGVTNIVVPKPESRPRRPGEKPAEGQKEKKGLSTKQKIGIGAVALAVGAFVANTAASIAAENAANQQRIDQLKAHGGSDAAAKSFNGQYGARLAGPGNVFNSSVLDLYDVHVDNATLADMIYHNNPSYRNVTKWDIALLAHEHPEIAVDTQREWKALARLLYSVKGIEEKPIMLSAGAEQVDRLIYQKNLAGSTSEMHEKAWNEFAVPGIKYMVDMVNRGDANITGLTRDEVARLLLPSGLAAIRVSIKDGELWADTPYSIDIYPAMCLDNGIKNVNPNPLLNGTSLQQWLTDVGHKIYNEKGARYRWAIEDGRTGWAGNWPNARKAYQERLKDVMKEDELAVFIYGNGGIGKSFVGDPIEDRIEPLIHMTEQNLHSFKVLFGRSFGRVVVPYAAPYPEGTGTSHDESFVKTKSGEYIGLWADLKAFVSDYANSPIKPKLVYSMDGLSTVEVDLSGVK